MAERKMAEAKKDVVFPPSPNLRSNSSEYTLQKQWPELATIRFDENIPFSEIGTDSALFGDDLEYGDEENLGKEVEDFGGEDVEISSTPEKKIGGSVSITNEQAMDVMKAWMEEHSSELYPTKKEKLELVKLTSWTYRRVQRWFSNARRRIKKKEARARSAANETTSKKKEERTRSATNETTSEVKKTRLSNARQRIKAKMARK